VHLSSHVEEHRTKLVGVWAGAVLLRWHWLRDVLLFALGSDQAACFATIDGFNGWVMHVLVGWLSEHTHDHRACAMSSLMLAQVIGTRELLATVGALEWLIMRMKRPIMALEMFLASEAAATERADESLGRVISQ